MHEPKSNCLANAATESFFGAFKTEYFHLAAARSIDPPEARVKDHVLLLQPGAH
jgi:hypothetical protein